MKHFLPTVHAWEEHNVRLIEQVAEGAFTLDSEWRFTFITPEAEVLLRSKASELLGKVIWSKFRALKGSVFEQSFRQTLERRIASSVITYYPPHRCWYEMRSYPAPEGMTVYVQDVSAERGAVSEFARVTSELNRQCRVYEAALRNTADYHYVFDLQGKLIYANPILLELWQKNLSEAVGLDLLELGYSAELVHRFRRQIEEVVRSRGTVRDVGFYTRESVTRDYEYTLVPVIDEQGKVEAVSGSSRDVTERRQLEADREQLVRELKHEQERLAIVFRQAPCFMCVLRGPDHVIEMANDRFVEHVGPRELVGRKIREVFPEFEGQIFPELLDRVYQTGMGYIGKETRVMLQRVPDQPPSERFVDFVFQPLRNAENAVTGILLQGVDLTERRRAQEELRSEEERHRKAADEAATAAAANAKFRVFFEQGAQFAAVLSLEGTVLEANRLCLAACGFTASDVLAKPFWECGWWQQSPELQEMVRHGVRHAAAGNIFRKETQLYLADGRIRTVDLVLAPAKSDDGRVLFVAATGTDLSERKRAETALRQSEARMRSIADSAPVLLWETDLNGLTFANQHYIDFYGRPFEELKGTGWMKFLHPDDIEEATQMYRDVYEQRSVRVSQTRLRRHDGEYRWLLTTGFPRFDDRGDFVGFVGSSSDVTEIKNAEQTQRMVAAELSRADRQKDAFLALLAHELRNPLAPLQSGLQMLALAKDNPSVLEQAREMMERQLGHMVRLIDDLLDISRVATNKMELRRARVKLAEIVDSAVETAEPVIKTAGHKLTVSLPAEPVHLNADLTRIAQVISNLLINSAKYTPVGGRISLHAMVRGKEISIAVTDTGIGIPKDSLYSIFNMFSQVDQSIERSTGGLGIGLALVKGLVELHGGTVSAESAGANAGSKFTVNLPIEEGGERPEQTPPPAPVPQTVPKHRILVVDDHRDAALGMSAVLKSRGHEVAVAHDGPSAIRIAETFQPDVILMDIGMPMMNGYEVTRKIRSAEWGEKLFIIAVTGWGQETDREHSREAGCNAHLVKPVRLGDLEQLLVRAPTKLG